VTPYEAWCLSVRRYFPVFVLSNFLTVISLGVSFFLFLFSFFDREDMDSPIFKACFAGFAVLVVLVVVAGLMTWRGLRAGARLQVVLNAISAIVSTGVLFVSFSIWGFSLVAAGAAMASTAVLFSPRYREIERFCGYIRRHKAYPPGLDSCL
jgi:hypothetical protein